MPKQCGPAGSSVPLPRRFLKRRRRPPGSSCGWAAGGPSALTLPAASRRAPGLRLTSQTKGFLCSTHRSGRAGFLGSGQRRFFPHHRGPERRCFCVLVRQRSGVAGYDVGSTARLFFLQCSLLNHFRNFLRRRAKALFPSKRARRIFRSRYRILCWDDLGRGEHGPKRHPFGCASFSAASLASH